MGRLVVLALVVAVVSFPPAVLADKNKNKEADPSEIGRRDINKGSWNIYSPEREIELGSRLAREAEATMVLMNDPVVTSYLQELAERIVRNSDAKMPVQLRIVDSNELNAFVLPGGFFFVNTGLMLQTESEAELAAVMAHEVAHVAARHATKQMSKAQILNWVTLPLLFIGGPIPYAIEQGLSLAIPLTFLKFDRSAEREADFLGLQYVYAAGYDPVAFIDFFERARQLEKDHHAGIAKAFATHPMTKDRIARAEKTIEQNLPPHERYVVSTSRYEEVKAYLRQLFNQRALTEKKSGPVLRKRSGLGRPTTNPKKSEPL